MSRLAARGAFAIAVIAGGAACAACGSGTHEAPLPTAGHLPAGATDPADDGTGLLARASARFLTGPADDREPGFEEPVRYEQPMTSEFGGFEYGGVIDGSVGGVSYAGYFPNVSSTPANRPLGYEVRPLGDAGAIAGTVTWASAPAARRLASPCGEIDNPTLRLGAHDEAGGAIVYLDDIAHGRPPPYAGKPLAIGGTVERSGCAMRPAAQLLAPAPNPVTVYAGDQREKIVVRAAVAVAGVGDPVTVEIAPGGFTTVAVGLGVTSIGDAAGTAVPGWIVAPGHPYAAITDDAGRFLLGDVVPGSYKLVVWHPPVVTGWRDGKPVYGAPVVVTRTVKVPAYTTAKADVTLPSR